MPGTRTVRTVKTTTDKWGNETTTTTEQTFEVNSDDQASGDEQHESRKQRKGAKKPKTKKLQQHDEENSDDEKISEPDEEAEGEDEQQRTLKTGSGGRQTRPVPQQNTSNLGFLEQGGLDAHNNARDNQDLPHLIWDADLAAQAKAVAEMCLKAPKLVHSKDSVLYPPGDRKAWQGENLAEESGTFSKSHNFFASAVDQWMEEEEAYDNGDRSGEVGHYTQVMWRNTQKVGMGMATNGRRYCVAARYWPAGNINNKEPF